MKFESISILNNPFPGLRPFEPDENHLFFGREEQSHELLRKLRRNRFVSVVGTSGSGKSSLVRAGVLPALFGGFMTRAGSRWRIAILRPGHDPIGNMARALNARDVFGQTKLGVDQATIIETTLRRSDLGLIEATRQARFPTQENFLVIVDQFEEIFRFKQVLMNGQSSDEATAFVTLLLEAAKNDKIPIYVVLTMRSDFLGECAQFRDLPEKMNEGQYLVPRMTRDQRRTTIEGPVAVGGGKITPRLLQQLLNDVGDNPDQLPILQHALMRTWDYWAKNRQNGQPIDLEHYQTIGTMNQALSVHADEAYQSLPGKSAKQIAERLFKTISERGADNREIRRPTRLGQICAITDASEKEVIEVIDAFRKQGCSFLMPPPDVALTTDTLIDVSHESLIRNWDILKKWVDEETQSAQIYRRLAETAVLYQQGQAGYWRDPDLQIALNWRNEYTPNEAWGQLYHPEFVSAMKFLDKSKASRDTEQADIEATRQRELEQAQALAGERGKAARRLRITLLLLTILVVAGIFAVVAFTQRQVALKEAATSELEKQLAQQEKVKADSTATALAALYQEADSLEKVASLSAEAEKSARLESEQQRQLALAARDTASIERERAQQQALLAEMRRNEAIAVRDTALKSQRQVQAVALAINSQRLQQQGKDTLSALLALEAYRLDELSDRQFGSEVYDALRIALNSLSPGLGGPEEITSPTALISAMSYASTGNLLAIGGADSTVHLLELNRAGQSKLIGKHRGLVRSLAFSPDGQRLASSGTDQRIQIWAMGKDGSKPLVLGNTATHTTGLAFRPGSGELVAGGSDGILRLWSLPNTQPQTLPGSAGGIQCLAFGSDGNLLAIGSTTGNVYLWDFRNVNQPVLMDSMQFSATPRVLAFSPDHALLAVGCKDGITRLMQLSSKEIHTLAGHQKRINTLAFSPDGALLATGSSDKTIRLWHIRESGIAPLVFSEHRGSIHSLAFAANGETLIDATFGREIKQWVTSTTELANKVQQRIPRTLTREEWQEFIGNEYEYPYGSQ